MKKSQMRHEEKLETPKQEASYHGEGFLRKALAHKQGLMNKGESFLRKAISHKQGLSKNTSFKRK